MAVAEPSTVINPSLNWELPEDRNISTFAVLQGVVRITSPTSLDFTTVNLSFQGLEETCIREHHTAETTLAIFHRTSKKFLHIGCRTSNIPQRTHFFNDSVWDYEFPFLFIVPPAICGLLNDVPPACRSIRPSLIAGRCTLKHPTRAMCPSLIICYRLHAEIKYRASSDHDGLTTKQLFGEREIEVLPSMAIKPPIDPADFPDEFILRATSDLTPRLLRVMFGKITITTTEPPPLTPKQGAAYMETKCEITVTIQGTQSCIKRLERMVISVKSGIRAKSFFSTKKINCFPTQRQLRSEKALHLLDEVYTLEPRKLSALKWTTHDAQRSISAGIDGSGSPGTPAAMPTHDGLAEVERRSAFLLPIRVSQDLRPTFCGSLSARSYSLLVKASVCGMHSKALTLEVPVQVANPSRRQSNEPLYRPAEYTTEQDIEVDLLIPEPTGLNELPVYSQ